MGGLRLHRVGGGAGGGGQPLSSDLDFGAAERGVRAVLRPTPLLEAPSLAERVGRPVLLKLESLQPTGSFKVRGALARLEALSAEERTRGVVACSSGNHGRAVAWAAARTGVAATIFLPDWVDPVKLAGIRSAGAEAVLAGPTYDEAEARALTEAKVSGRPFVSAYDDPWVIAGQGTLGLELADGPAAAAAAVVVPLSGGGLAGGVAAALRHRLGAAAPPVTAVSADRAAVMRASLAAGRPVEVPEEPTVASALAGGIGLDNRWSFPLVRDEVAAHVTVTEHEIKDAIAMAYNDLGLVVEGGGAVGLAAVLSHDPVPPDAEDGAPVVVVVSGGNIALDTLSDVLREHA
ncbi:MAG: pyridoxal-phosphate dependent enzyme [Longimicrobiales bacterium]